MRKQFFYKDKNAGNPLLIVFIVFVLIFVIVIALFIGSDNTIEEETSEFGKWGQKVIFEFEDGSTGSLGSMLSLIHEGKKVKAVNYELYGSASGTYDSVNIDLSGVTVMWSFIDMDTQIGSCVWQDSSDAGNYKDQFVTCNINVDDNQHDLLVLQHEASSLTHYIDYGEYIFQIKLFGNIRYHAGSSGIWQSVTLPSPITVNMEKVDDNYVTVELSQDVTEETETGEVWSWSFISDDWNEVMFTSEQLSCCSSNHPVDVFSSIDSYWIYVFEDDTWKNYWYNQADPNQNGGTLQSISPDVLYWVDVNNDCTFTIAKC